MAEQSPRAIIVSADITHRRLRRVVETCARLGLENIHPTVADGRYAPFRGGFRCVLLDAPCSSLGVLQRRPDARWLRVPGNIADLARLQGALLEEASRLVAPGGWLVYSACSLETEETDDCIRMFLDRRSDFCPGELPEWLPAELRGGPGIVRVIPGTLGMEGMFAALLHRPAAGNSET